jgi:pyridoxamine 5'-phosphate oxidase
MLCIVDKLADERRDYARGVLDAEDLGTDPLAALSRWIDEALAQKAMEPTAMNLATVGDDLMPSARLVLCKRVDAEGIRFYTNYESQKGRQLAHNPRAAATFFWPELERQVRLEGLVERVTHEESETYFHSRPRKSQLAALASHQSAPLESRDVLQAEMDRLDALHPDVVPMPATWGGYLLRPRMLEFWQGRRSRLHDRIRFDPGKEGWRVTRLAP